MFQQFLVFLLFLFISPSESNRIPLAGNDWTITNNINYTAQGQVPGTIHTILLAANQIPDPYVGYNDVDLRYLVYQNWTFTKKFNLTADFLNLSEPMIHFDQVDTVTFITINKCPIGRTNSMFVPYTFPIPANCLNAENEIEIYFQSPIQYASEQALAYTSAYNDSIPPNCTADAQHGECHVQFIRKEPCSFSWDWGPAFAPIGIPGDLYLEGFNKTEIVIELESVNLAYYNATNDAWQVDVMLSSINDQFTSKLKFVLENTTWTYETNVTFNHNLSISLIIPGDQVSRWWPNGYGNQTLYRLVVSNDGNDIDGRHIGFRTVELIQREYGGGINGTSFFFAVNSKPIFIKGSNWIPSDSFQERVSDDKFERLLTSAKLANMNMLRVWGGGIYERHAFYHLADQLGIMLWHDFMFACSLYPVDEPFLTSVNDEVIYQVKRLQSHASIVLWSGNNENEAAIAQNWYGVPPEKIVQRKDEYRKLYVTTVMNAVKQVDKGSNRPFVTSSPSNGLETVAENFIANNPQDPLYGDVHFYGYGDDSWNFTTYPITRFLSETGIQSLPSLETWRETTSNLSDLTFNSSFILHREHSGNQMTAMLNHIEANLPLPMTNDSLKHFEQMIYLSQIHQAMTLKSISDLCRVYSAVEMIDPHTSQGNTMGLMYWQINDIWQAPTWATIEYNLKWKMGHYYVRHMYSPIYPMLTLTPYLANATDENAQLTLYMINELFNGTNGVLTCSFHTLDTFTSKLSFGHYVSFNSPGLQRLETYPYATLMRRVGCTDNTQCIIHCSLDSSQYQNGQTLFLNRPKNYQLYNPNLQINFIHSLSSTDFAISITAERPALFVWLDTAANVTGYFSRNGFNMFEPTTMVTFHSWAPITNVTAANFNVRFSLFDVTLP